MPEFKQKTAPKPPPVFHAVPEFTPDELKLARWLHETTRENEGGKIMGRKLTPWADLEKDRKDRYARLARSILATDFADILK